MRNSRSAGAMLLVAVGVFCAACGSGGNPPNSTTSSSGGAAPSVTLDVVPVVSQKLKISVRLPGELQSYEVVAIYPKVTGFVKMVRVDRGSRVKAGDLLAQLEAPELVSQRAEAQARLQSAESQRIEAEAKLSADESTYQRLKAASATPGVISGNELELALRAADADRARAAALRQNVEAARQALKSVEETEGYLRVTAPFDGVVTERNVHPGALVGPGGGPGASAPMLRLETLSRLRLVVPVPESYGAGVPQGSKVSFSVPSFPGQTFTGTLARVSHSVDMKTRTMPVELEVANPSGRLEPGTYSEVVWPVERPEPTLFVPSSAVVTTLDRVFVVRIRNAKTEWVDVKTGANSGPLIEVFGELQAGDTVVVRGSDELRPGTAVTVRPAPTAK